jgi:hypothetical protein
MSSKGEMTGTDNSFGSPVTGGSQTTDIESPLMFCIIYLPEMPFFFGGVLTEL